MDLSRIMLNPRQTVPTVLAHYDRLTEAQMAEIERELARFSLPDASLLYALRISKCVPKIKTYQKLAGRWEAANYGAGGAGLQGADSSEHFDRVRTFLVGLYLKRFHRLCERLIKKGHAAAGKRDEPEDKLSCWRLVKEKLNQGYDEFIDAMPGLTEHYEALAHYCDEQIMAIEDPRAQAGAQAAGEESIEPASERQKEYARALGVDVPDHISKNALDRLIRAATERPQVVEDSPLSGLRKATGRRRRRR